MSTGPTPPIPPTGSTNPAGSPTSPTPLNPLAASADKTAEVASVIIQNLGPVQSTQSTLLSMVPSNLLKLKVLITGNWGENDQATSLYMEIQQIPGNPLSEENAKLLGTAIIDNFYRTNKALVRKMLNSHQGMDLVKDSETNCSLVERGKDQKIMLKTEELKFTDQNQQETFRKLRPLSNPISYTPKKPPQPQQPLSKSSSSFLASIPSIKQKDNNCYLGTAAQILFYNREKLLEGLKNRKKYLNEFKEKILPIQETIEENIKKTSEDSYNLSGDDTETQPLENERKKLSKELENTEKELKKDALESAFKKYLESDMKNTEELSNILQKFPSFSDYTAKKDPGDPAEVLVLFDSFIYPSSALHPEFTPSPFRIVATENVPGKQKEALTHLGLKSGNFENEYSNVGTDYKIEQNSEFLILQTEGTNETINLGRDIEFKGKIYTLECISRYYINHYTAVIKDKESNNWYEIDTLNGSRPTLLSLTDGLILPPMVAKTLIFRQVPSTD